MPQKAQGVSKFVSQSVKTDTHKVQFYGDHRFLVDEVVKFIKTGDASLVVAAPVHRKMLKESLKIYPGIKFLDAGETLNSFMHDGMPDRGLFRENIGGILQKISKDKRRLRVYGEMVAILAEEGKYAAAIQLEKYWNELLKEYPFQLFCAYPLSVFNRRDYVESFVEIGNLHTHVAPTEKYSGNRQKNLRLRELAVLEQKANVLESEIEKHKETEKHLTEVLDMLTETEKRKEELFSATSHELKTPLTSQKAYIDIVLKQMEKNKDTRYMAYINKIRAQTEKLAKLVFDLLDVSKIAGGNLKLKIASFDLTDCISELTENYNLSGEMQSIKLKGVVRKKVIGDKEKIFQVLSNLVDNAFKYSGKDKSVEIDISERDGEAELRVIDQGIGIRPEEHEKIFQKYYRVDNGKEMTYPGLGIGLYISNEIIKQHGGRIRVKSDLGKGAEFRFSLPYAQK